MRVARRGEGTCSAARPEFAGPVAFVETRDFVRKEEESPGGWPCHEYNNAETCFLVGKACGEAMKKLLPSGNSSEESGR